MKHYTTIFSGENDIADALGLGKNECGVFEVNSENQPIRLIGTDGCEPEDKTLLRHLFWVEQALNAVARERDEAWQAKKDAEKAGAADAALLKEIAKELGADKTIDIMTTLRQALGTVPRLTSIMEGMTETIEKRDREVADARKERDSANDARERDWLRHRAARADARAYLVGVFDIDSGQFLGCDIFSEENPTLGKKFPITLATGTGDSYEAGVLHLLRQLEHPAMSWLKAHMVPRAGRRHV